MQKCIHCTGKQLETGNVIVRCTKVCSAGRCAGIAATRWCHDVPQAALSPCSTGCFTHCVRSQWQLRWGGCSLAVTGRRSVCLTDRPVIAMSGGGLYTAAKKQPVGVNTW